MTWIPLDTNAAREENPAVRKVLPHLQTHKCNRKTCSQWFNAWTGNYTRCQCSEVKQ